MVGKYVVKHTIDNKNFTFSSHRNSFNAWVQMGNAIKRGYNNVRVEKDRKVINFDERGNEID